LHKIQLCPTYIQHLWGSAKSFLPFAVSKFVRKLSQSSEAKKEEQQTIFFYFFPIFFLHILLPWPGLNLNSVQIESSQRTYTLVARSEGIYTYIQTGRHTDIYAFSNAAQLSFNLNGFLWLATLADIWQHLQFAIHRGVGLKGAKRGPNGWEVALPGWATPLTVED